ncbi:MAG: LysM peptidoglycan-binding domain-containing protein, partial [Kiritimatiellae bacterium]|nr:LysM peptidoglycan-binding domain-containing protein [Kiritimatiellia bacterium]
MTMKRRIEFPAGMVACCVALAFSFGCRQAEMSASDRVDRASRHYAAAMAELQAGRIDSAIKGFQDVVHAEPGNGNAHFQLAALLEDVKKDYLGAMIHYRLYCLIRPESEKAAVALDRIKGCETRYAVDAMTKAGVESKISAELEALRAEHRQCGKKLAKVSDDLAMANRRIASLEKTVEMKAKMLEKTKGIADDTGVATAPKKSLRPTDAQLLDDDDDGGRRISSSEIKSLRAMLDEDERTAKPPTLASAPSQDDSDVQQPKTKTVASKNTVDNPFQKKDDRKEQKRSIPETYTVEEGDTLMRISAKFYGTNRKWRDIRDANRTIISSDGRVRAGQVIKLP